MRLVCLDYYLAKPIPGLDICHSQLEGTAIERVPVVQIYGATPGGQKTCLHLHKVGLFTSRVLPSMSKPHFCNSSTFPLCRHSHISTHLMKMISHPSLPEVSNLPLFVTTL